MDDGSGGVSTGLGVYEVQFTQSSDSWSITELLVCGDRSHYRRATDTWEALHVEALIDGVLLRKWDTDVRARLRATPRELA